MYLVFDLSTGNLIGCHEELDVVEEYQDNLLRLHNIESRIKFCKDKKLAKKYGTMINDMHLTVYRKTYVPNKYVDYMYYNEAPVMDLQMCKDTLISLYGTPNLSPREEKILRKAIYLVDDFINDNNSYTPTISELENMKNHYDEMMVDYDYDVYNNQ